MGTLNGAWVAHDVRDQIVDFVRAWVPRDFWLEDWEKQAIIGFHQKNPLEGYRRLRFMMLDREIVAVSPSSVRRVLSQAGLEVEWKAVEERNRLRATAATAPALARRYLLYQHRRHVLLSGQRAGWFQPVSRALGST